MSIFDKLNELRNKSNVIVESLIQGVSMNKIASELKLNPYTLRRFVESDDYINNELLKYNCKFSSRPQIYSAPNIEVPAQCRAISKCVVSIRCKLHRLLYNIINSDNSANLRDIIESCHTSTIKTTMRKYGLSYHTIINIKQFRNLKSVMKYIILNYNQNEIIDELMQRREHYHYIRRFCNINRSKYQELKIKYYPSKYFSNYITPTKA